MSGQEKHFYQFGPFRLDPVKRRLLRGGEPVPLTPKAFETLLALVRQRGRTVEKDELMRRVWPGAVVEENNLNQNITALRKTLGDSRHESQYIATVPGLGYRFVADVWAAGAEGADALVVEKPTRAGIVAEGEDSVAGSAEAVGGAEPRAQAPLAPAAAATEVAPPEPVRPRQPPHGKSAHPEAATGAANGNRAASLSRRSLLILAPLALAALGYALYVRPEPRPPQLSVASIVVLPLENLSGDPAQEYFADGMTDALIGDLARIGELRVISRTSSMHYKGTKKSLPEIAGELKVDAVVEGTVQRSGERVRIRAQLIHATTDRHLWAATYERDVRDVLDLQSEIARAIAREVRIKTTPAEQARLTPRKPVHPRAFDDYLQGRYLFWNKRTEENLGKAIEFFQSAISEDPAYALAYVGLADCYNSLGSVQIGALPPVEARRRAEEAAVKALELDPSLAEAHSALGYVKHYNWEWAAAEQEIKRALDLNPNQASAHISYASYLMSIGRVEESIAASNRARELDPLSLSISVQRGFLLENARRYDEAIEQLQRVIAVDQNHYQAHWMLGHIYAADGQFEQAVAASEKAVALSGRAPGALGMLGMVYGLAGRKGEAAKVLKELLELNERRYVTPAALAYVHIGLGDKDRAFVWLEKAYQEHSNFIAYLKVVPVVDPLRSDPRFADLVRRVGLPQ
ncbi:MAG TPA: winged helix-turn-helix domain-containing protein [Pyrinomonadaceae bacterium]|nr:winged helix-turn-helix domain-containing protein [Pyrinomonadaceae bacterium]